MRGPRPKSASRKLSEGDASKVGVHRLEQKLAKEPRPARGLPECPKHLSGRAREAWVFFAEELRDMGLDCRPDALALEGACTAYSVAAEADEIVGRDGILVGGKANPALLVSNRAWAQFRQFASELGLSPASRTRLSTAPKTDDNLAELLSGPRPSRVQ